MIDSPVPFGLKFQNFVPQEMEFESGASFGVQLHHLPYEMNTLRNVKVSKTQNLCQPAFFWRYGQLPLIEVASMFNDPELSIVEEWKCVPQNGVG